MKSVENYLDKDGKVKTWPSKRESKLEVLKYISTKFQEDCVYTEKEVNFIIEQNHTFGDYFLIRRELIESHLLSRTRNCSRYWKTDKKENDA